DLYWFWPLIILKLLDQAIALGELAPVRLKIEWDLVVLICGLDRVGQVLVGGVCLVPARTACGDRGTDGRHLSYFESATERSEESTGDRIASDAKGVLFGESTKVLSLAGAEIIESMGAPIYH